MLRYLLDETEFLSPHGIRSVSRVHREQLYVFRHGNEEFRVDYDPPDGTFGMLLGKALESSPPRAQV